MGPVSPPVLRRLVGVYDADHTLRGEVGYWIGARLGRAHCALCDITHGLVRERPDWRRCRAGFAVPFDTYHRDDQPAAVRAVVADHLPAVVAETDDGVVALLDRAALEGCGGSPERLVAAVEVALARAGLG
jgi:hypothetical protein